jgi:hypothetical protein
MLDTYALEETLKLERELFNRRQARRALWLERMPVPVSSGPLSTARRRLARVLLALADRLDPRAVVSVPHMPAAPRLNGTLHHV